ncbi:MAG: TAXI family TRAP transporter solute-binding subunit [Anaerolineaceae bacterium]|nr:TAXI family TRAP transporter solute-binding subunit [Anaerolineaceae bacterium]
MTESFSRWLRYGFLAFFLLIVTLLILSVRPLPPTFFKIGTGGIEGAYYQYALEYQAYMQSEGISVELVPGAGSVETLDRLRKGEIDFGFVQGGTLDETADNSSLLTLGSVFYEPIWLVYRSDIEAQYLSDFQGMRIAIGGTGSGVQPVALDLLAANGITEENSTLLKVSAIAAVQQITLDGVDAAFFIVSPRATFIQDLMLDPGLKLFDFSRAPAYAGRFPYLSNVTVPQGLFDLQANVPSTELHLLAVTAQLVTRSDVHPNLVRLMMREAIHIHHGADWMQAAGTFPSAAFTDLPLHSEARRYLREGDNWFESNFPFVLATFIDRLIVVLLPLFSIYTIFRSILPVYSLNVQLQTTRWYTTISAIDRHIDTMTLEETEHAEQQLDRLQHDVTHRITLPFLFMGSVYTLKIHIRLVKTRLEDHRAALLRQAQTSATTEEST